MNNKARSKKALQIGVVYFSKTGHTEQLAKAIIKGIQNTSDIAIIEHNIRDDEIVNGRFCNELLFQQLTDCDAITFGSPTYMGSVAAQFKAFLDSSSDLWEKQLWADKWAVGFTCGAGLNGEQTCTLQTLFTFASQHGMLWLGLDKPSLGKEKLNRMGCQIG
ncbi:MAG: flavodoxin, partial [Gammaproteobacteria bacterium]